MRKSLFLAVIACFLISTSALATQFTVAGTNYPTSISALIDFNYTGIDATNGQVTIDITNTSSVVSSLTAFAFNAPGNVGSLELFTGPAGWSGIYTPNSINTPMQYGFFDLAGITGPNFNGGKTAPGIDMGQSGSFTIDLGGTAMTSIVTADFLGALSDLGGKVGTPQYFAARFQGIGADGEGSDVAVPGGTNPVPEPSTVALMGIAMFFGLIALKRKGAES